MHVAPKKVTALVVVLVVMNGQATAQEAAGETTGSISPPSSAIEKHANTSSHPTATEPTSSGIILVSKAPIEVLARPSSSAVVMYGFPAGRRFRLIGHEAGFAQIKDLKSGATGWIDETTLWQSPGEPAASAPSKPKPTLSTQKRITASLPPKPKPVSHTHKTTTASPKSKPKATSKDTKTSSPEHTKHRSIFGPPRKHAQGVLF